MDPTLSAVTDLLLTADRADRIASVAQSLAPGVVRVDSAHGSVTIERFVGGKSGHVELESHGQHPIADHRDIYAYENLTQFFDSPVAPDALVLHQPTHQFHGNLGDHGMLCRQHAHAPFLVSGRGFMNQGIVDRHLRMIDVTPTVAFMLGCKPWQNDSGRSGWTETAWDGGPDVSLLTGEEPEHVVIFLIDGCNPATFANGIAEGTAPRIAELARQGTTYAGGVLASLPTATLANHTVALTGMHPGHSGILHNTWRDTAAGAQPDLLDGRQMFSARQHIHRHVETLHETIHRTFPDARTTATYEYADRGADWSTFIELDQRRRVPVPEDRLAGAHPMCVEQDRLRFISSVDVASAHQAALHWSDPNGGKYPMFQWVNFSLTDETGHAGGPHSDVARQGLADTDGRIGQVIDAIDAAGRLEQTAFVVMADHGMAASDAAGAFSVQQVLDHLPLNVVDESFLYLS